MIRTGPATKLIKIGRFKASVASKYPWQYLRAQYLPRTNGQGQIMLMRHISNSNASKTNRKVARYEQLVLSYLHRSKATLAHGSEWFRNFDEVTLNKILAAMKKTNKRMRASAKNGEWMKEHQKESPTKAPQPSTKAVIKTTKLGKAKGKNHVAANYARRPILTKAEFIARGLKANEKNPEQFPNGNGYYYAFKFPKYMGGGVKYIYHRVAHV